MGLGGRTTVLGVRAAMAYCHTASLPVAINLQCWAARRASARVFADGTSELVHGGIPLRLHAPLDEKGCPQAKCG